MIDRDLAELYSVQTRTLNQAVRRNIKRFPEHFIFQLSKEEKDNVVANCDHLQLNIFVFFIQLLTSPQKYTYQLSLLPGMFPEKMQRMGFL